jgi:hypothetical protein
MFGGATSFNQSLGGWDVTGDRVVSIWSAALDSDSIRITCVMWFNLLTNNFLFLFLYHNLFLFVFSDLYVPKYVDALRWFRISNWVHWRRRLPKVLIGRWTGASGIRIHSSFQKNKKKESKNRRKWGTLIALQPPKIPETYMTSTNDIEYIGRKKEIQDLIWWQKQKKYSSQKATQIHDLYEWHWIWRK